MRTAMHVLLLVALAVPADVHAQSSAKERFRDLEIAALAEPFRGITTDGHVRTGLFQRREGASARPLRDAAAAFLESLDDAQRTRVIFAADDPQWRRWSNLPPTIYDRNGVTLRDLTEPQRARADALLRASLSEEGWRVVTDMMRRDPYGADNFWLTVLGTPSSSQPWGWQLQGHHLAINCRIVGDQLTLTPMFLGAEPVEGTTGRQAGTTFMQTERDRAAVLVGDLTESQRARAVIAADKRGPSNLAEAFKDNLVIPYAGVRASELTHGQRRRLLGLVRGHLAMLRESDATQRMKEVRRHLDETYFAWIGGTDAEAAFYYRIHSPVILVEFDHQPPFVLKHLDKDVPTREHIHVMMRTPNGNDYGAALTGIGNEMER
jgi:hypothetical protein